MSCGLLTGICVPWAFCLACSNVKLTNVIRQHRGLPYQILPELHPVGTSATGEVFEQPIELVWEDQRIKLRRIVVKLNQPTRAGDSEIAILTSLPATVASAIEVAQLYRNRWTIEEFFQSVTLNA
jgi:IS4 transposase